MVIYFFYAYAFEMGKICVLHESWKNNKGNPYDGGDVASCMLGVFIGAIVLGTSMPNLRAIVEGRVSGYVIYDTINRVPAIPANDTTKQNINQDRLKGEIKFEKVSFTYPTRPDVKVLDNFSATFAAGKTTAIVGPSGSGKSTVIQMIERFYDPDSGRVLIDDYDLVTINLRSLRRCIGYVSQEPVLFNTSIKENLKFGKENATDEEIIEALKSANAYDFIQQKMGEKGIDTMVGSSGG